jgi:type III pantothenate kinase
MEPAVINALNRLSKRFVLFDHFTPLPIANCYQTPDTLGHDRIAAAVGAAHLCPNTNLLIIDAGSAVTYDFLSSEHGYLGGNIAPGIKMRLTALNQMTKRLPKVEMEPDALTPLFGKNTKEAIAAGVVRGLVFEVKGYMRQLKDQKITFTTYVTGGHAPYILNAIKKNVIGEPHLVLIGLNKILEYNNTVI